MKSKVLRLLSLILAITTVALLASGCSTSNKNTNSNAANVSSALSKTPITLSIALMVSPVGNQFGVLTDPVSKYIQKETGITINAIDASDSSNWSVRLNALMASNDLPDIFMLADNTKDLSELVTANQVLPLDKYITPTIAPNMSSDSKAKAAMDYSRATLSPDGKTLYTLGMCRGTWDDNIQPTCGNFFREDLWAQLGHPAINSYDDLLTVLKQMQDLQPKTPEGKKVYAIGTWFGDSMGWGDWDMTNPRGWATGNLYLEGDRTLTADISTGLPSTTCTLTDPNSMFWQQMEFYYKANQMGILDPDSFTQKWDAYNGKENAGQYLYVNEGWNVKVINNALKAAGHNTEGFTQIPPIATTEAIEQSNNIGGERQYCVSASTKYPERAVHLLDWLESYNNSVIMGNGIPGVYWTQDSTGKDTAKPALYDGSVTANDMAKASGYGVYNHLFGYCSGTINPSNNEPIYLGFTTDAFAANMNSAYKDLLSYFGTSTLPEGYNKNLKTTVSNLMTPGSLGLLPDDLQTYDANLSNYEFQNMFKIMLAKNDADYAKQKANFISGLAQFKVQDIYKYWYDKATSLTTKLQPVLAEYNSK